MTGPSIARGIIGQAQPILVGQLALMAYAVVDTVLTGHASAVDLATMGLGLSVYSTVFVGLLGAVNALNPIIAQHYGADRQAAIGVAFVQGIWMALILSAVGCAVLAAPQLWLHWLRAPAEVEPLVTRYLHVLALGLPGSLLFRAIYSLNTAVSRPRVVMALQLVGLVLKVLLSYTLIFGALGLPRLGAVGAAVASVIVFWTLFGMGLAYMRRDPFYRRFGIRWTGPRWPILRELFGLGIPMTLSYTLEATSFTVITLLAARLGTTVMGGHQVVANLAALCFMVPLSLAIATATLTAQSVGAGDLRRARHTALTGMRIGAVAAAGTVALLWTLRGGIVRLYTGDPSVAAMALTLVPFLAAFHFFDALQTVATFVLRAYKIALAPTVVHAVALWGIGVVGGYQVAFGGAWGAPWGLSGMWMAQAIALALAAVLLVTYYLASSRFRRAGAAGAEALGQRRPA
ncbi:MAG TPA: MATE family efflux transporter [Methylomirabilota bacterium]|nr:MATE family efflux transporter [Methylomirabilota bacterium]